MVGVSWRVLDAGAGIAKWTVSSQTLGRKGARYVTRASGRSRELGAAAPAPRRQLPAAAHRHRRARAQLERPRSARSGCRARRAPPRRNPGARRARCSPPRRRRRPTLPTRPRSTGPSATCRKPSRRTAASAAPRRTEPDHQRLDRARAGRRRDQPAGPAPARRRRRLLLPGLQLPTRGRGNRVRSDRLHDRLRARTDGGQRVRRRSPRLRRRRPGRRTPRPGATRRLLPARARRAAGGQRHDLRDLRPRPDRGARGAGGDRPGGRLDRIAPAANGGWAWNAEQHTGTKST